MMALFDYSEFPGFTKLRTRNGRTEDSDDSEWASVQTMQDTWVGVDV